MTAFSSLPAAVSAAIAHGNTISDIKPELWSKTYGDCGSEAVRAEFEKQQWAMTQQPQNNCEVPDGK